MSIVFKNVDFQFEKSGDALLKNLSFTFEKGWNGVVGPNGCGKSTLLSLINNKLQPTSGAITVAADSLIINCEQKTLNEPSGFCEFQTSCQKEVIRLKSTLDLHELFDRDWQGLSQGERKRFQLGVALSRRPDILLVDEPTNHLDAKSRAKIISTFAGFTGIGVLISHDRELLNSICTNTLLHSNLSFQPFKGGYDLAQKEFANQAEAIKNKASELKKKASHLQKEVRRIDDIEKGSSKRLSKKGLKTNDHDTKTKIDRARLTGKDASLSKKKAQITERVKDIDNSVSSLSTNKDYSDSIFFNESHAKRKSVLRVEAQKILLPTGAALRLPDLHVFTEDKIAIQGANGVGKSTFLNFLSQSNQIDHESTMFIRQELDKQDVKNLNEQLSQLDKEQLGRCLQIFARLGSDSKQLLRQANRSPGEIRKLAISLAIVTQKDLLILDEPTNHLDLPSIEKIEDAFVKCNLSLILVSHDERFLEKTCLKNWTITKEDSNDSRLEIK